MKRTKPKVIRTSEAVKINPKEVPAFEFQIACSVLATSIKRALADPQLRADFDRWNVDARLIRANLVIAKAEQKGGRPRCHGNDLRRK